MALEVYLTKAGKDLGLTDEQLDIFVKNAKRESEERERILRKRRIASLELEIYRSKRIAELKRQVREGDLELARMRRQMTNCRKPAMTCVDESNTRYVTLPYNNPPSVVEESTLKEEDSAVLTTSHEIPDGKEIIPNLPINANIVVKSRHSKDVKSSFTRCESDEDYKETEMTTVYRLFHF